MRPNYTPELIARFWDKVDRSADCWLWTASRNGRRGQFSVNRRPRGAHLVAWEITNGDIPDGHVIRQSCGNPLCVNPAHLAAIDRSPAARFWRKVERGPDCWEWNGFIRPDGYGMFGMTSSRIIAAHRAAWELANGPIPDGLFVCHRCDNPRCVRPDHLFLGTSADNMEDRQRKGRTSRVSRNVGVTHGLAILNEKMVREMRQLYEWGVTQAEIAARFGVASETARAVVLHHSWRHIE